MRSAIDVKPLGFIWLNFPEHYNERNTIMFDDLKRNFLMNPQNGLQIRPFRNAHLNRYCTSQKRREPGAAGSGLSCLALWTAMKVGL